MCVIICVHVGGNDEQIKEENLQVVCCGGLASVAELADCRGDPRTPDKVREVEGWREREREGEAGREGREGRERERDGGGGGGGGGGEGGGGVAMCGLLDDCSEDGVSMC